MVDATCIQVFVWEMMEREINFECGGADFLFIYFLIFQYALFSLVNLHLNRIRELDYTYAICSLDDRRCGECK